MKRLVRHARTNPDSGCCPSWKRPSGQKVYLRSILRFDKLTIPMKFERQPANRKDFPKWGRGGDDVMNLTKYLMIKFPMDNSFGPTDRF